MTQTPLDRTRTQAADRQTYKTLHKRLVKAAAKIPTDPDAPLSQEIAGEVASVQMELKSLEARALSMYDRDRELLVRIRMNRVFIREVILEAPSARQPSSPLPPLPRPRRTIRQRIRSALR